MKKIIHIKNIFKKAFFFGIINLAIPFFVESAGVGETSGWGGLTNPLASRDFPSFLKSIAVAVGKIGLPVAAIFIIYSGLMFVTARGDETQLKKAKSTFMWAMAGTAVLLGAWVIAEAISKTVRSL